MKKLFSILAAALVAFSFASCDGQQGGGGTVESNGFKLTVDSITATSAFILVAPNDTNATYLWNAVAAKDIAGMGDDSIIIYLQTYVEDLIAYYGMYGKELTWADLLDKGASSYTFTSLAPNSDYYVVAVYFDEQGKATDGKVGKKLFKTADVKQVGEKNLGEVSNTFFEDYRDYDGSFQVYAWDDDETFELGLNIYDDDFVGNFTEADIESYYSYVEMGETKEAIAKAQITGTADPASETATMAGWVLATDGIKYNFSFTYSTVEEEDESAAAAPKKVNATKKNVTFKKHAVVPFKK